MEVGTLEDLKRKNAESETADTDNVDGGQQDLDDASNGHEEAGEVEVLDTESELDEGEELEEGEEEEVESWMVGDEQASQEENGSNGVPVKKHVNMRKKLKATISERESEIDKLRRENEALKSGSYVPEQKSEYKKLEIPRPKASDYMNEYDEFDAGSFDKAVDQWQQQYSKTSQEQYQAEQDANTQKQKLEATVDSHYGQAEKLVESGVVTAEDWATKDRTIRETLEDFGKLKGNPGKGDETADWLISQIGLVAKGEDAAKLHYKLGASPSALQEVINAYTTDQSGGAGVAKLAELARSVTNPVKRRSKAPKPSTQLDGGDGSAPKGQGKNDMRKYRDAMKKGDHQTSFNLKRNAKKAGVDVSKW